MNEQFVFSSNLLAMIEEYFDDVEIQTERLTNTMSKVKAIKSTFPTLNSQQLESLSNFISKSDSSEVEGIFSNLIEQLITVVEAGLKANTGE